jgi:hypothetical protein
MISSAPASISLDRTRPFLNRSFENREIRNFAKGISRLGEDWVSA